MITKDFLATICIIATICGSLGIPTLVLFWIKRWLTKNDKKQEERAKEQKNDAERYREKRQEREDSLDKYYSMVMQRINNLTDLAEATALAVSGGKVNGEMKAALKGVKDLKERENNFTQDEFIRNHIGVAPRI